MGNHQALRASYPRHFPLRTTPQAYIVLDEPLYQGLRRWAKRDDITLSLKVRDLGKDELDMEEDRVLTDIAERWVATFSRKTAKTHAKVWGTSKRPRR
ncbi:MAG TPA: hypothetical protein PKD12_17600 [Nitrospira sp.]|nr:hypothetical protein [Nitrospira sp.]